MYVFFVVAKYLMIYSMQVTNSLRGSGRLNLSSRLGCLEMEQELSSGKFRVLCGVEHCGIPYETVSKKFHRLTLLIPTSSIMYKFPLWLSVKALKVKHERYANPMLSTKSGT